MAIGSQAPTGLARRGRRLSDRETEERMLRAALAMVKRDGLTVSLDHISFEDVIRDADVSRSAVYRRWPYKDLFVSDLVKELARDATPAIVGDEVALLRRIVTGHLAWLETAQSRQALLAELFRQLALLDFQTLSGAPEWRTYLALHATFMSLSEGELRDQVQAALAQSERARLAQVAASWAHLAGLFGYRLRPGTGVTFETIAALVSAQIRGLVVMALTTADTVTQRLRCSPFGAHGESEWSLPALGVASIATTFLEPDPAVAWDKERIARVREALSTVSVPDP